MDRSVVFASASLASRRRYVFPKSAVHPLLPDRPAIAPPTTVLALYPGTTCFYGATVVSSPNPASAKDKDVYIVMFQDDNEEKRRVRRELVIPMPTKLPKLVRERGQGAGGA